MFCLPDVKKTGTDDFRYIESDRTFRVVREAMAERHGRCAPRLRPLDQMVGMVPTLLVLNLLILPTPAAFL